MDIYEIVMKLTGEVRPIGESGTDNQRLKNLYQLTALVDSLLGEIDSVAVNSDRHEYSMRIAGEHARDFLADVKSS